MNILIAILLIALIVFLIALVVLLLRVANTIKGVQTIISDNKRNIDISILEVSRNLEETSKLLKTVNLKERELRETLDNVEKITTDISTITNMAANTVKKGEEIMSTTSDALKNFNKISGVFNKGEKDDESN